MSEPQTPGQIAYEGYMAVHLVQDKIPAIAWGYTMLEPHERAGWEAAAQAVLEAFVSSARPVDMPMEDTR